MHRHTANILTGMHATYMITYRERSKYTHLLTCALSTAREPQPIVFFGTLKGSWCQRAIIINYYGYCDRVRTWGWDGIITNMEHWQGWVCYIRDSLVATRWPKPMCWFDNGD